MKLILKKPNLPPHSTSPLANKHTQRQKDRKTDQPIERQTHTHTHTHTHPHTHTHTHTHTHSSVLGITFDFTLMKFTKTLFLLIFMSDTV